MNKKFLKHYVASCTVKWVNDKLLTFFKDAGLDGKAGWQLFKEKEYLGKQDNQKEVEKSVQTGKVHGERTQQRMCKRSATDEFRSLDAWYDDILKVIHQNAF